MEITMKLTTEPEVPRLGADSRKGNDFRGLGFLPTRLLALKVYNSRRRLFRTDDDLVRVMGGVK